MRAGIVTVYAITTSRTVPPVAGVRAVRVGTLAALVSDGRRAPAPTAANLRRYHRTVAAIADALPSMLPVRFGTAMAEAELAVVLHTRAASLSARLQDVRGRVQMTVRLTGTPSGELEGSPRKMKRPLRTGRDHLRELAARERDIPGFDSVRQALRSWIAEERVERRGTIVSVYHLIPRRSARTYTHTAAAAIAAAGLRGIVSGPFPPYAFSAL